jgi:hypothetical protein
MALKEIRAVLDLDGITTALDNVSNVFFAYNKKVNLTEFNRHSIQTADIFHNTFDISASDGVNEVIRHTFISTYPISFYSGNLDAIGPRVPNASDENIHYRETEAFTVEAGKVQDLIYSEKFPDNELAGFTNLSFYTPFVYITVLYLIPGDNTASFIRIIDPSVSLYLAVDETPVNDVEYGIGIVAERESAQWAQFEASGVQIANNVNTLTLNTFPMYFYGGRRSQGMLRYDAFGGDTSFYYRMNKLDPEEMRDIAGVRSDASSASKMVQFNEEFGSTRLGTFYPDWLAQIVYNLGGGKERVSTNMIPKRYNDDGTTRMFTP